MSDDWITIGTLALVLVTAVYAGLTLKIARATSRAATAAEKSAASAQAAAEANARAAAAAEAQVSVAFEASYAEFTPVTGEPRPRLRLSVVGARVYLHEVRLTYAMHLPSDIRAPVQSVEDQPLRLMEKRGQSPRLLYPATSVTTEFPFVPSSKDGSVAAWIEVTFSLGRETEHHSLPTKVEFPGYGKASQS
jgi:hypothetical protein